MPDLDLSAGFIEETPAPRRKKTSRLTDLISFAEDNKLTVGSTTGGRHNSGSKHYSGNAIDIRGSGAFDDQTVTRLRQSAAERGLLLRDERRRPPRQKVWGGPHVHIEAADVDLRGGIESQSGLDLSAGFMEDQGQTPPRQINRELETAVQPTTIPQQSVPVSTGRFGAPQSRRFSRPIRPSRPKQRLSDMATGGVGVVAPPGVGELRRLDDPTTQQITRIQQQVTSEQTPVEREMKRAPGTRNARLLEAKLTENEEVLRRLEEEKDTAKREAAAAAETKRLMAQFTDRDKAEIDTFVNSLKGKGRHHTGVRTGARTVGASALYKLAGLTAIANAVQKPLTGEDSWIPDYLRRRALVGELAVEDIPPEQRGQVAEWITQMGLGLAEIAVTPGGPVTKFAGLAGTESIGRGQSAKEIATETAKGATIGQVFKSAGRMSRPAETVRGRAANLAKEGAAIGAGTYATERAFGTPVEDAALSAATNVALHGVLGAKRLRGRRPERIEDAREAETQRQGVSPEQPVAARQGTPEAVAERIADRQPTASEAARDVAIQSAEVVAEVPPAVEQAERRRIQAEFDKIKESAEAPVEVPVTLPEPMPVEAVREQTASPSLDRNLEGTAKKASKIETDVQKAQQIAPDQKVEDLPGIPVKAEQPAREVTNETTAQLSGKPAGKIDSNQVQVESKAEAAPISQKASAAPSGIARVRASELDLDPDRFQFRVEKGDSLRGVKQWNPDLEGVISVWRDPADGKTYIVNGHNRFEKAQELGVRDLTVRYVNAKDAVEARALGAKINIAEGHGTALDAAQYFKDTGDTEVNLRAEGIPLERAMVKDGLALSKLDDFIFNAVKRGELSQEHGVAIGNKIASPDLQAQAYKAISKAAEKGKTLSKGVVDEMLDAIGAAPRQTETEQSLFGDFETERSLFNERAQVAAAIKRQLAGDKTLFGTAARRSERLAEGGTKVDVEQAKQLQESASEVLGVFDTLKNRTGGISDILDAGAKQVAAGKRPDAVAREAYGKIKQAVNETIRGTAPKAVERGAEPRERAEGESGQRSLGKDAGTLFAEPEPSFVKSALERNAKRAAEKAEGIEYRRAGADPYELIDNITIKGWDLYSQKVKPTFEEWSRKIREEFGPESESHLRKVWVALGGPEPSSTAAKREKVTADRAARGEEPIPRPERKSDEQLLADAKEANAKDPTEPLRLIDQVLNGKKGALSDKETVQVDLHVQELKNKYDAVNKKLAEAKDPEAIKELSEQSDAMEREMRSSEEAFAVSGTEKGRALRAQRIEIDQDFRLLTMMSKAIKSRGRELTRDERATIKQQHDRIAELETNLTEANERLVKAEAERAVGKIRSDVARENRRAGRRVKRESLDQEAAELKSLIAQAWKRQSSGSEIHSAMGLAKLDPEGVVTKLVVQLAKNRVEAKIGLKAEALVDEVHGLLRDTVDLSRREVAEMISGYGKTFELSQESVDVRLRELKSIIASNLGKADVIEKGIRPLRRGLQRDKPTQEVRAAMRDLRDTLREHGMQVERSKGSPEEQQQSALDAAKTRTKNRIEDLSKWIKDGKRTVANKTEIIPDPELKTLQAERDRLQKVFDAIVDPAADLKKIENSLRSVNKSVVDLEAKIRAGNIAAKPREAGLTSPELEAARAEQKALRGIIADLRKAAKPQPTTPEIEAKRLLSANKALNTRMEKQIADLERRMKQGDFSKPEKREPVPFSRENLALQKQLEKIKQEYARANYKATRGRFGQITDEMAKAANVPKTIKSMGDISAVFRQGGFYSLTHPVAGFAKPTAAMLRSFSETGFRNVEQAIQNHPKYEQAKRDGVEFTGVGKGDPNLSHMEESFFGSETIDVLARGKYNPLKGVQAAKDFSQRTFVSFLDSQRMQMYDVMSDGLKAQGLTPRSDPASYKGIAKLINIGTGRGNLGKTGNQAAPLLNIAMFSPRLVASRVQLLNNMLNPVAIARMPKGVRAQNIKDNVKFLAATSAFMALATAAGGTVNRDPDDADFLKIRFGRTTYDTLTGLQQPLRYIVNMGRAAFGGETYPGQGKAEMTKRFARSKASPAISPIINWVADEDFMGRKFSLKREASEIALPLPAKDFWEAMEKEGLIKGFLKATPALTGVGVQTYDQPPEKPGTAAEKLARKIVRDQTPDVAREEEQIERDEKKADLRSRARKGEDVTAEVEALGIPEKQQKYILDAKGLTRLQEDFKRIRDLKKALAVYSVMTRGEQQQVRDILATKAMTTENLPDDEQAKMNKRLETIGLTPPARSQRKRPQRPSRSSRQKREGYQWATP